MFLNSCLRQALTATTVLGGAAGTGAGAPGGAAAAVGAGASGVMGAGAELEGPGAGAEEEDDAAVAALAERLRVRKERAAGGEPPTGAVCCSCLGTPVPAVCCAAMIPCCTTVPAFLKRVNAHLLRCFPSSLLGVRR